MIPISRRGLFQTAFEPTRLAKTSPPYTDAAAFPLPLQLLMEKAPPAVLLPSFPPFATVESPITSAADAAHGFRYQLCLAGEQASLPFNTAAVEGSTFLIKFCQPFPRLVGPSSSPGEISPGLCDEKVFGDKFGG